MNDSDSKFRRNVTIVGTAHVLALVAFFFGTRWHRDPPPEDVMWLDGGGLGTVAQPVSNPKTEPTESAKPDTPPEKIEPPKLEPEPVKDTTPSELVALAKPTPAPTPAPSPTPKPTPKPSPKPSPKPKPSASPKKSGTPKPSPKASSSPHKKAGDESETSAKSKAEFLKNNPGAGNDPGTRAGTGGGNRGGAGHAGGGNRESDFGWYYSMIHDRFYGRWEQPTSIISSEQKYITTVKIRIEKSGAVSNVSLAKSSGNVVMDDSVMAAARRVSKIEALPKGLGGEFFEVNVNFELSQSR